jgi:hypothetical protein
MSLARALAVAMRAAAKADGSEVKLQRGEVTTDCVSALRGNSAFETIDSSGAVLTVRSRDFLIEPAHYDFGDGPVEPARGDLVIEEQDDGEHTYELLDLPGQPSWRWSDQFRARFRLHTKEITKPT